MRILTHTKLVQRNRQLSTYLFIATIAALIGGFVLVNINLFTGQEPDALTLLLQLLVLPVALVMTLISIRMTNLWARQPRPEDAMAQGLKGLSNKSVLYHYCHIPCRHLLITPQGIFAIVTRWHEGEFRVENDKWTSKQRALARFFSTLRMDGIGDPTREALRAAEHVQKLLAVHKPDVRVQPLIVFVSRAVNVEVVSNSVPVLYADAKRDAGSLTSYLRSSTPAEGKKGMPLSDEQLQAFEKDLPEGVTETK